VGMSLGSALAGPTYTRFGYASNTFMATIAILVMAVIVHFSLPEPSKTMATTSTA